MRDIIEWLTKVEHLAGQFYDQASRRFPDDPEFTSMLQHCAEDEAWHFHAMNSAAYTLMNLGDALSPDIELDTSSRVRMEKPLTQAITELETGAAGKAEVIEFIVGLESSEWNDIFVYVVEALNNHSREFIYPAARIQNHLRHIQHYLDSDRDYTGQAGRLKRLPRLWEESILVVDDEPAIRNLMTSVLSGEAQVDQAVDGVDALEKISRKFYKVIVCDISMPRMSGLELLARAREIFPDIPSRFLFISGHLPQIDQKLGADFLPKPFSLYKLRDQVAAIMGRFREQPDQQR